MAFNSLTFDGINSLDYGIYITGESVYDVPERDVEAVEIAGRNGDYLLDKGRWKNLEVTYRCGCFGADQTEFAEKIRTFRNLLASRRGYKRITDTYNTTEYRMGTFMNPVEVDSVSMKRAGEFDVTFNCKPQRYLTSGETAATVANNGTLTNPTAYASSPLLAVKGYGTITFNGYSITLNNEVLGETVLTKSGKVTAASETYSINTNLTNSGDTISVEAFTVNWRAVRKSSATTITSHSVGTSGTGSAEVTDNTTGSASVSGYTTVSGIEFTAGTSETKSFTTNVIINYTNSGNSGTATLSYTVSVQYTGSTVKVSINSPSHTLFTASRSVAFTAFVADSTVSVLGNPTYIDCEIGEAYMVKNNEYVSLNRYIDLGSDLPILASGSNTFTKPTTVTELKVTPRWWQL